MSKTGDYFGFLLPSKITAFPFTVCDHPMFLGSSLLYLSKAIYYFQSPVGCVLAAWSYVVYIVAGLFEECVPPHATNATAHVPTHTVLVPVPMCNHPYPFLSHA